MTKPLIGYTTRNYVYDPLQWMIHFSIIIAGGRALRLRPDNPSYDKNINGLIIGGGTDVYPTLFKLDPKPNYVYDHPRDEMEIKWFQIAKSKDLPILGICRGAQLLNVARGGSLHIDISKVFENAKYPSSTFANIFYRKPINVIQDTLLSSILSTPRTNVNSMHKQAINTLGEGLKISATEDNGIIQAVEDPSRAFCMGVQFHPEALIYNKKFRSIFKRLIKLAKQHSNR